MSGVSWEKRALALAGMVQACHLVSTAARTGLVSQDSLDASLQSIFVTNPDSISEVYRGTEGVRLGLRRLKDMLTRFDMAEHGDDLRYVLAVVKLDSGLQARPEIYRQLGADIALVDERRAHRESGGVVDSDAVEELARAYEDNLSAIEPRIRVSGNRHHLQSADNIHRIRALLLAAVRSAVLWRQVGGRRWQFIFARGKLARAVDHLM